MIEKISIKVTKFVTEYISVDSRTTEIYKYGFEIFLSSTLNIFLTMTISLILGAPLSGLTFLVCLIFIRSYCGGYHANTYFSCNLCMIILFLLAYFISCFFSYLELSSFRFCLIILFVSFIPICLFSPVQNKHKTIPKEKEKKFKIVSIVLFIILGNIGLLLTSLNLLLYGSIIIMTLLETSVMILIEKIEQRREKNGNKNGNC